MRNRIVGVLVLFVLIALPGLAAADDIGGSDVMVTPAPAPTPAPVADEGWKFFWEKGRYLPQFEFTGRPGTRELYGFTPDLMIPVAQDERNMIFLNTTGQIFWDDGDDFQEFNLGVGYRRLMGDSSWILGGYAYWDRIWTQFDNTFDQAALGVEALSWNWEARMNGYIGPETFDFTRSGGVSQATLVGTKLVMNSFIEQQTNGFDMEAGWRLPFFGEDGWLSDTRILAGGFWFTAPDLRDFGGPMVRFETRIWDVPFLPEESRLTLGTSYRWDDVRGSQVQGQLAVRVPLGRPDQAYRPINKVERRMMDRPVRDISVVAIRGDAAAEEALVTSNGTVVTDGYYFDFEGEGDHGSRGVSDGSGDFNNPMDPHTASDTGENTLLIGLDRTGPIDIVDIGTVYADHGQTWLGGGTPLQLFGASSGQPALFTPRGTAATWTGSHYASTALELATNNVVAGFHFENLYTAINYNSNPGDRTRFDIYNNHFRNIGYGVRFDVVDTEMTAFVRDNIFEGIDSAGVETFAGGKGSGWFDIDLTVRNNKFSFGGSEYASGVANYLSPGDSGGNDSRSSSFAFAAHDNVFDLLSYGIMTDIYLHSGESFTHSANIEGNQFSQLHHDGYRLDIRGGDDDDDDRSIDSDIRIAHNLMTRSFGNLVDITVNENRDDPYDDYDGYDDPIRNGKLKIDIHENQTNLAGGIGIDVYEGPDVDIDIARNELFSVFGLQVEFGDDDDDGPFGIDSIDHHAAIDVYVGDSGSYDEGGSGEHRIDITENLVQTAFLVPDGISAVALHNPQATHINVSDNVVRNVNCLTCRLEPLIDGYLGDDDDDGGHGVLHDPTSLRGINVWSYDNGVESESSQIQNTVAINGNTVEFVGSPLANAFGGGPVLGDVSVAGRPGGGDFHDYGIYSNVGIGAPTHTEINDNTVYGITGVGIYSGAGTTYDNTIEIQRNHVDATGDAGIVADLLRADRAEVDISNNHVSRSLARGEFTDPRRDAGIDVSLVFTDDATVTIDRNTVVDTGDLIGDDDDSEGDGISLDFYNSSYNTVSISNNEISRSEDDNIDVEMYGYGTGSDDNTININGNTMRVAGDDGFDADIGQFSDDNTLSISRNSAQYLGDDGFTIDSYDGVNTYLNSDADNEALFYDDDAADVDGNFTGEILVNGYGYTDSP